MQCDKCNCKNVDLFSYETFKENVKWFCFPCFVIVYGREPKDIP